MRQCWLRPNRRAIGMGLVAPAIVCLLGLTLLVGFRGSESLNWLSWLGGACTAVGAIGMGALLVLFFQPRLAQSDNHLLVYLGTPRPLRVPIDLVECFFLGHGPSLLPPKNGKEAETQTVVVRLAEAATQWKHRDVKPALGHWCDGYIVIRGTWCEPLTGELVLRLNQRLIEAHRRQRQARELETA